MKQPQWPYWDVKLFAFLVPMLFAQAITAHGTWIFYSYMLPPVLAASATVVLAVGVPLLEFAGMLDKEHRAAYLSGMGFLLLLEGMAQYFQGQPTFVLRIAQQFDGIPDADLLTLAQTPAGRVFPIFFLAALSIVVVGFGAAAANRVGELRKAREQSAKEAQALAALTQALASKEQELATARDQLAAQLRQTATDRDSFTTLRDTLASKDQELAALRKDLARTQHELANAPRASAWQPPTRAVIVAYVAEQMAAGRTRADVARELAIPESTLRGMETALARNGHEREVVG